MKIADILKQKKLTLSFEIFPPKPTADEQTYNSIVSTALELSSYKPDFISVTYGAGGGTSNHTADIAARIQKDGGIPSLAHLSCISSTKGEVSSVVEELKKKGIHNVLALRGDIPQKDGFVLPNHYTYASDLIQELKKTNDFCIGAACYPEGHPECHNKDTDIDNLKKKADAGCDFLTTQMIFDNNMLYSFLYKAQLRDITLPILAGIMPVTNASQIKRMMSLSNAYMPRELLSMIDRFADSPESMKQAGIAYATNQIIDLIINGICGIHIYTMNKPDVAKAILRNINSIIEAVNNR